MIDYEMLGIGFTLGFCAKPVTLMLMEHRSVAERERRAQDQAVALRILAGLPPVSHDLPPDPPRSRSTADWLAEGDDR